jgi:hypothetical protein
MKDNDLKKTERTKVPPRDSTQKWKYTPMGAAKDSTWDSGPVEAVKITT